MLDMIVTGASMEAHDYQETSPSVKEIVALNKNLMPNLHNILLAMDARQVARQTLHKMGLPAP